MYVSLFGCEDLQNTTDFSLKFMETGVETVRDEILSYLIF